MNSRIVVVLIVAAVGAVTVGLWLGGWGDKLPTRSVSVIKPVVATPTQITPPAPISPPSVVPQVIPPAPPAPAPPPAPPAAVVAPAPAAPMVAPVGTSSPASGDATSIMPNVDLAVEAAVQIDKIGLMFRDYRTLMGENPVGTNAEIIESVNGGNPKQAKLGPPEGQKLNERGELMDAWGTAYFFHQKSVTDMEIHSAGPDKQFGTSDDIIGR